MHFDVISTAGAGALIGLLYSHPAAAKPPPRHCARQRRWVSPMPSTSTSRSTYKVFQKPGAIADAYRTLAAMNPFAKQLEEQYGDTAMGKRSATG